MKRKWLTTNLGLAVLFFIGLFSIFIAVSLASFGIEFHHDYFSIISAYLQSLGLSPHAEAYNHYGIVDSTFKEIILKFSGRLVSVKISYVIINVLTCLLIAFSTKKRSLRFFLGTFSILWFVLDPSLLGIKDFSSFLGTISPPDSKLTKLAWPSDLANLFGALWIFLSIRMYRNLEFTWILKSRNTIIYGLLSGLLVTLTWLTKFTLGASFFMAVLISLATLFFLNKRGDIFPKVILYFLLGVTGSYILIISVYQLLFDGFLSAYVYQTFTVQKDFFGVSGESGSVGILINKYLDILKEKLFGHQLWWLAAFFLVMAIASRASIGLSRLKKFFLVFISTVAGFYLYKYYGHSIKSVDHIVSFVFTSSILIWILTIERLSNILTKDNMETSDWSRNELNVFLVFLTPISYLSLLQIAPLGDPLHIWWSSLFLFNLFALQCILFCKQTSLVNGSRNILLIGISVCALTYASLQLNHSYKELIKLNSSSLEFVRLGKEYGMLEGLRVDSRSKQGSYLTNIVSTNVSLKVVAGPDALPELLSNPSKYAKWSKCLGAPLNIVRRISPQSNIYSENLEVCIARNMPEISD